MAWKWTKSAPRTKRAAATSSLLVASADEDLLRPQGAAEPCEVGRVEPVRRQRLAPYGVLEIQLGEAVVGLLAPLDAAGDARLPGTAHVASCHGAQPVRDGTAGLIEPAPDDASGLLDLEVLLHGEPRLEQGMKADELAHHVVLPAPVVELSPERGDRLLGRALADEGSAEPHRAAHVVEAGEVRAQVVDMLEIAQQEGVQDEVPAVGVARPPGRDRHRAAPRA